MAPSTRKRTSGNSKQPSSSSPLPTKQTPTSGKATRQNAPKNKPGSAPHAAVRRLTKLVQSFLFDIRYTWYLGILLLAWEVILNVVIIKKIPYTEIDWKAYMQEVGGFLGGERDYMNLKGDTGPLVYPAGFVYIYSALYALLDKGANILGGQYVFMGIYLINSAIVYAIYAACRLPPFLLILLTLSKRIHSIFVLRLFNDPIAILFLYACVYALIHKRWLWSTIFYSLALSIKMNILLYAPAFALIMFQFNGVIKTGLYGIIGIGLQIVLALPFLLSRPMSYLNRAFEFSRVFFYKWTVNWKFVPEDIFLSKPFANTLLLGHLSCLLIFLWAIWNRFKVSRTSLNKVTPSRALYICDVMFSTHFIGIMFARSLHYQFYSWYFHTLPYLVWRGLAVGGKGMGRLRMVGSLIVLVGLLAVIEVCWNIYPSNVNSSMTLFVCHLVVLGLNARSIFSK